VHPNGHTDCHLDSQNLHRNDTSMIASIEDGLACAIVGVPAVDLIDLVERHTGGHIRAPRVVLRPESQGPNSSAIESTAP
jgi:hypothetical protein